MREKEQMAEKGITEGLHAIISEVIQIMCTYRSDRSTNNELVYIQQNKWALHCPFCEAHCYCLVLDVFVLIRSICISVVQSFSLKI